MGKSAPTPFSHFRRSTAGLSLALFLFAFWYLMLTEPESLLVILNKAFADTAILLISLSFALSGICYFWDFFDTKIIYRKYLGLAGFAFALSHGILSFVYYFYWKPSGYENSPIFQADYLWPYGSFLIPNIWAFVSGLSALAIFSIMAAISNQYAMQEIGGVWWRRALRVGYLALVLGIIHFGIKNIGEWGVLLQSGSSLSLPPLNFIVFLAALATILLRLGLAWSLARKAHATTTPPPQSPAT